MRALKGHDDLMPQVKGVQRRPRVAKRDDLVEARWAVPKTLKAEAVEAATASGVSEGIYVERLFEYLKQSHGGLPVLPTTPTEVTPAAS